MRGSQPPDLVIFGALVLLQRLKAYYPWPWQIQDYIRDHERLFMSSLIAATKIIQDGHRKNKDWCKITGGKISAAQISQSEKQLYEFLSWHLVLDFKFLREFGEKVVAIFRQEIPNFSEYQQWVVEHGDELHVGLRDKVSRETSPIPCSSSRELPWW